jgi:hypothetical protein
MFRSSPRIACNGCILPVSYQPASQVRHLESLLRSLGMKGQPTKGKAKSLKQKRELAAELRQCEIPSLLFLWQQLC